ncbi:MAG: hypothetical protein ACLGIA_04460 [Actinomycetes bacterium]
MGGRRVLTALALAFAAGGAACTVPAAAMAASPAPGAVGAGSTGTAATATRGCGQPGGVPAGAATAKMPDVDGDGHPDTLWISSDGVHRRVGVTTTTGATFSQPIITGSPVPASALGFKVRRDTGVNVVMSDGRLATLYAARACSLTPVIGPDGQPFKFDQGFAGNGTGMGCVNIDRRMQLVGLLAQPDSSIVKRTVITLHGTTSAQETATIGRSQWVHVGQRGLDLAYQITCGQLTMQRDGVHEPQV